MGFANLVQNLKVLQQAAEAQTKYDIFFVATSGQNVSRQAGRFVVSRIQRVFINSFSE